MVEIKIGILCASVPATKALFSRAQRAHTQNDTYQYHSRDRSAIKCYSKGSANENKTGSAGTVIQNESYELKDAESTGRPDTRKEERGDGGTRRVPDSGVYGCLAREQSLDVATTLHSRVVVVLEST
jgi:hypothetical protein